MRIKGQKLTKIVATLGPASESPEIIKDLIMQGVNVFRFNTKHGTPEWHEERIQRVQKVADELGVHIGILLDLQGPELRLETKNQEPVTYSEGEILKIAYEFDDEVNIIIPSRVVFDSIKKGELVLIDDGYVEGHVHSVGNNYFELKMDNSGVIKHRKGVNLPGKFIDLPSLIENDFKQLDMAALNKIDFVGLSFVRTKKDVEILRSELEKRKIDAKIVSKIENQTALDNLEEIVSVSDAIMVARGDLGIETPIEQIAFWQKKMIRLCREQDKPVITATQMLESMIENARPTRAEATDVANAILDGTDAIMLSAESAAGKHPVQAVRFMTKTAVFNESKFQLKNSEMLKPKDTTEQISHAAYTIISNPTNRDIDAVVIFTETGYTARTFASYHMPIPIIAVTDSKKTAETLTLSYGVYPYIAHFKEGDVVRPELVVEKLIKDEVIDKGQTVLVIHGKHWRTPGLTNSLTIIEA